MNVWLKQAKRNAALESGVPVNVPGFEGWTFYVRAMSEWNVHARRAMVRIMNSEPEIAEYVTRANAPGYVSTPEDETLDAKIMRDAFAEGNVANWTGVTNEDGDALPYSVANVRYALGYFPQVYSFLNTYARNTANFPGLTEVEKEEIALGNFSPASSSSSDLGGNISNSTPRATGGEKVRLKKQKTGAS